MPQPYQSNQGISVDDFLISSPSTESTDHGHFFGFCDNQAEPLLQALDHHPQFMDAVRSMSQKRSSSNPLITISREETPLKPPRNSATWLKNMTTLLLCSGAQDEKGPVNKDLVFHDASCESGTWIHWTSVLSWGCSCGHRSSRCSLTAGSFEGDDQFSLELRVLPKASPAQSFL